VRFQSRRLLRECRSFVRMTKGSSGAHAGTHDDRVMAMAIGLAARAELVAVPEKQDCSDDGIERKAEGNQQSCKRKTQTEAEHRSLQRRSCRAPSRKQASATPTVVPRLLYPKSMRGARTASAASDVAGMGKSTVELLWWELARRGRQCSKNKDRKFAGPARPIPLRLSEFPIQQRKGAPVMGPSLEVKKQYSQETSLSEKCQGVKFYLEKKAVFASAPKLALDRAWGSISFGIQISRL
jgi:hypothetical protein